MPVTKPDASVLFRNTSSSLHHQGYQRPSAGKLLSCWLFVYCLASLLPASAQAQGPFSFEDLVQRAGLIAQQDFKDTSVEVPKFLLDLDYDHWRDIRFNTDQSLWRKDKLPFEVQFFHPGLFYNHPVAINVIDSDSVAGVPFSPDLFNYGNNTFKNQVPPNLGFAGFSIRYPINKDTRKDVVTVFLGASYFRALGKDQSFGMSARGLAVDTALRSGEEFPYFKEFWLEKPAPDASQLTVYALLDSPSVSGAYRFTIRPGAATQVNVEATLFQRRTPEKLSIAPLTSMFFYGENSNQRPINDFRPEVHDSDGLLINSGSGEWLWRPLVNPQKLLVSSFDLRDPAGFGLIQRDGDFDHYQDLEAHSELRPSTWVKPGEGWGDGRIELVEIPSGGEANDNIVAYWVPKTPTAPFSPLHFSYQLLWGSTDFVKPPAGYVAATRTSRGTDEKAKRFIVEFAGSDLESLPADASVEAVVNAGSSVKLLDQQLQKNVATGGWRLVFQILPSDDTPVELRAYLKKGDDVLTETWSYLFEPS